MKVARSAAALLMSVTLMTSSMAVCAGWLPTPEARMDCCTNGDPCPMHESSNDNRHSTRVITQDEADRCCASSERGDAAPSTAASAAVPHLAIVVAPVPFTPFVDVIAHLPETAPPALLSHVPKHLLLSVILV
jgi:hypothetical protein